MMTLSFNKISGYYFTDSSIFLYYKCVADMIHDQRSNPDLNMNLVHNTGIIGYDPVILFELGLKCDTVFG